MASRSWNRVELIGNVTKDPELRYTPSGAAVCTFSIATNRTFVTDGEKREETDFHRLVAWNKLAELCSQLIKKGNRVFVSGRLQNRSWETPEGQNRQTTEIVIEDMILLTSKFGGSGSEGTEESSSETVPSRLAEEMPKGGQINQIKSSTSAEASVDKEKDAPASQESEKSEESDESEKTKEPEEAEESKKKVAQEDVSDLDDLPF